MNEFIYSPQPPEVIYFCPRQLRGLFVSEAAGAGPDPGPPAPQRRFLEDLARKGRFGSQNGSAVQRPRAMLRSAPAGAPDPASVPLGGLWVADGF